MVCGGVAGGGFVQGPWTRVAKRSIRHRTSLARFLRLSTLLLGGVRVVRERARRGLYLAVIDRMGVSAPWVPGARAGEPGDRR